jgi:hypothetical protein
LSILSQLSRVLRRVAPHEQFVIDIAKELKRRGIEGCSFDPASYSMVIRDVTKVGLNNAFRQWRLLGRREKAALVERFIDGQVATPRDLPPYDVAAEMLVPLVRSRSDICLWLLESQIGGAPPGNAAETAWLPLAGDLVAAVGLDYVNAISRMVRANLEHLGVAPEQALQRALENFRKRAPKNVFIEIGHGIPRGVYHSDSASDYQSSMLLLPERLPKLPEGDGDLIVMVPGRNSMWITGSHNEAGLSALLDVAEKSFNSVHHRCSVTLLRLADDGKWTVFAPHSNEQLSRKHSTLMKKQDAVNYAHQKVALDKLYRSRGEDIYVAQFKLAMKDDLSKSVISWASHADSLLPSAEFILFVEQIIDGSGRAVGTKGATEVPWTEAFPLVQHLMEEAPDLYPPRYRVRSFPDANTLAELARRGVRREVAGGGATPPA